MSSAKDMVLRPITAQEANALVKRVHYSGKVVNNSQIHIGAFLNGKLEGALQFGPSLDKRKIQGLVEGTGWNEFIELNRMAFTDALPRNSESRAIAIAMKLLRKHAPHIKWVVTFADGAQCGDGTIYRAAGFVLTQINPSGNLVQLPSGETIHKMTLESGPERKRPELRGRSYYDITGGRYDLAAYVAYVGGKVIPGFQFRYLYFIDPTAKDRLTVPILPFSEIQRRGAGMYRGEPRAGGVDGDTSTFHVEEGGSIPTPALHDSDTANPVGNVPTGLNGVSCGETVQC